MKRIAHMMLLTILLLSTIGCSPAQTTKSIDCTEQKLRFDDCVARRYLPIIEDNESLCHGLYVGSDFANMSPKWAVGRLIAVRGSKLTFEGVLQDATIMISAQDSDGARYQVGNDYRIDMNNVCREFFAMADSRYPSPISATFVAPEEIECED
jgi:hypothetical protein